jgi:hypothetical protein
MPDAHLFSLTFYELERGKRIGGRTTPLIRIVFLV